MKRSAAIVICLSVFLASWILGRVSRGAAADPQESNRVVGGVQRSADDRSLARGPGARLGAFKGADSSERSELLLDLLRERPELICLALAHWAGDDPQAALAAVETLPRTRWRESRAAVVGEWMCWDAPRALEFLEALNEDEMVSLLWWGAFQSASENLVAVDPRAAVDLMMRALSARSSKPWGTLDPLYQEWVRHDLKAVVEWAAGIDQFAHRSIVMGAIGTELGALGREGLALLEGLDLSEIDRRIAEDQLAWKWAARDTGGVTAALLAGEFAGLPIERELIEEAISRQAGRVSFEKMRELFERHDAGGILLEEVQRWFSWRELAELVPVVLPRDEWPTTSIAQKVVESWVVENPTEAANWVRGFPSIGFRTEVGRDLIMATAREYDAERAIDLMITFDEERDAEWVAAAFGTLAHDDPAAWVDRTNRLSLAAKEAAQRNLLETWEFRDPQATAEWIGSLEANDHSRELHAQLATMWAKRDVDEVGVWANELEPGARRDAVVQSLVGVLLEENSEKAQVWVQSIEDETMRTEELARVLRALEEKSAGEEK